MLSTHGHHLISLTGFVSGCIIAKRYPWKDAKQVIVNVVFIALSTLSFAGARLLGAEFIHSPSLFGMMGRGVVHLVGGVVGTACVEEAIEQVFWKS